jgi:hypothetical protein
MHKVTTIALTILVALSAFSFPADAQQANQAMAYQVQPDEPDDFEFMGNFPNPVRDKSFFKFRLNESQQVAIHLFDLLGNQKRSIDRELYKPGTHTVEMEVSGLKPGIYFYKVHVQDQTITKRLNIVNR